MGHFQALGHFGGKPLDHVTPPRHNMTPSCSFPGHGGQAPALGGAITYGPLCTVKQSYIRHSCVLVAFI